MHAGDEGSIPFRSTEYGKVFATVNTKICSGCKRKKPATEFHWRSKKKGIRISRCRGCASKWSKNHYQKNKEAYLVKAKRWNRKNREVTHSKVLEHLREHPCVDCGERDPVVLTFDHVRGRKKAHVAQMIANNALWKIVKKEIEKCDVRCANCHARKSAGQRGYWKMAAVVQR